MTTVLDEASTRSHTTGTLEELAAKPLSKNLFSFQERKSRSNHKFEFIKQYRVWLIGNYREQRVSVSTSGHYYLEQKLSKCRIQKSTTEAECGDDTSNKYLGYKGCASVKAVRAVERLDQGYLSEGLVLPRLPLLGEHKSDFPRSSQAETRQMPGPVPEAMTPTSPSRGPSTITLNGIDDDSDSGFLGNLSSQAKAHQVSASESSIPATPSGEPPAITPDGNAEDCDSNSSASSSSSGETGSWPAEAYDTPRPTLSNGHEEPSTGASILAMIFRLYLNHQ